MPILSSSYQAPVDMIKNESLLYPFPSGMAPARREPPSPSGVEFPLKVFRVIGSKKKAGPSVWLRLTWITLPASSFPFLTKRQVLPHSSWSPSPQRPRSIFTTSTPDSLSSPTLSRCDDGG